MSLLICFELQVIHLRHNGKPFSTFDSPNHYCAQLYHGAWWYAYCHDSNPNGKYLAGNDHTYGIGLHWHSWHGWTTTLKATVMMKKGTSKINHRL